MNRHLFSISFLLGAGAILWVGAGFVGTQPLALLMTLVIAAVYGFGTLELRQFRQANAGLSQALMAVPDPLTNLGDWLATLPPALQNPVRLRIEGERMGLPGPVLTPYLIGLLVMLGMLGTFLGMVVTLNGAAFSLEGTTDLQTIRTALAAPIKGLGLAFGTSVAGVAASAMLGLMSALSRRERLLAAQALDSQIATRLRRFSLAHQRQETYAALQAQTQVLPAVVSQLQAMMAQMERSSAQLNAQLLGQQDRFHSEAGLAYRELAASVDQSLRDSLTHSARLVGESIQPVLAAAMAEMAQHAQQMHQRAMEAAHTQVDGLSKQLAETVSAVTSRWSASLADQASDNQQRQAAWMEAQSTMAAALQREWQVTSAQTQAQQQQICTTLAATASEITAHAHASADNTLREITRLMTCSEDLIRARAAAEADSVAQANAHVAQLSSLFRSELSTLRVDEAQRGQAAVQRLGELQTALASHLTTLGTALEQPITRLIESAAEAPRAAAEVIAQLRGQMSAGMARDNELLQERTRILETLGTLLDGLHHAAAEQRAVADTLVNTTASALSQVSQQFSERVDGEAAKLADIAAQVTSSAVEVASLGDTFGFAVHSFHDANQQLIGQLQRIEGALDKSMARSDEQLAYYVAQAREVIDLSVLSQKEIFEELRQLPGRQARPVAEVN